jgi:hypothetical protein
MLVTTTDAIIELIMDTKFDVIAADRMLARYSS